MSERSAETGRQPPGRQPPASPDARVIPVSMAAAGRLGFLVVALADQLQQRAEGRLADLGLDGHDYSVLAILAADGPGTQNDVAKLMNRAPTVIVTAVDKLERKGFVERQRDPADRRRSRVTPTPAGLSVLSAADDLGERVTAETLRGLGPEDVDLLHRLLQLGLGLGDDVA